MIPFIMAGLAGLLYYKYKDSPKVLNASQSILKTAKSFAILYPSPIGAIMTLENQAEVLAKAKLKKSEGYRNIVYKDTRGYLTAGIGHKLTAVDLKKYKLGSYVTDTQIMEWFSNDVSKAFKASLTQAKELGKYQPDFIASLVEVNFQLGTGWKNTFKNTYNLLKTGNIAQALKNLNDSDWNDQTPIRVANFQSAIKKAFA